MKVRSSFLLALLVTMVLAAVDLDGGDRYTDHRSRADSLIEVVQGMASELRQLRFQVTTTSFVLDQRRTAERYWRGQYYRCILGNIATGGQ